MDSVGFCGFGFCGFGPNIKAFRQFDSAKSPTALLFLGFVNFGFVGNCLQIGFVAQSQLGSTTSVRQNTFVGAPSEFDEFGRGSNAELLPAPLRRESANQRLRADLQPKKPRRQGIQVFFTPEVDSATFC